jgi:hypothetical protein
MIFARRLAVLAGVVLPLGETVRRWHQLGDPQFLFAWLDDWLIGAFLLYGAWRAGRDATTGQASLAAAWGFTLALAIGSFFTGVFGDPDPTGASRAVVVVIKGAMLLLAIGALVSVLRWQPRSARHLSN